MSELAVEGNVNLGNFREATASPYEAVVARTAMIDGTPAAEPTTPIQQALAQPAQVPAAAPPAAAATPGATEQTPPPVSLVSPYETPEPATPEAPAEPEPAWMQQLRIEQQQTREMLGSLAQRFESLPTAQPAAEPLPDLSLMSDDELRQFFAEESARQAESLFEQRWNERMEPLLPVLSTAIQEHSKQAATAYFDELKPVVGEFDYDQAHVIALGLTAQQMPPEQAMLIAAQRQHEFEKGLWERWSRAQQGVIDNVVSAPSEIPAGPAAGSEIQPTPTGRNAYEAAKNDYFARRAPRPIPTA